MLDKKWFANPSHLRVDFHLQTTGTHWSIVVIPLIFVSTRLIWHYGYLSMVPVWGRGVHGDVMVFPVSPRKKKRRGRQRCQANRVNANAPAWHPTCGIVGPSLNPTNDQDMQGCVSNSCSVFISHNMSTSTARRCVLSPVVRMAGQISESLLAKLNAQVHADPQLPRPNPTPSFWQLPPHPTLAEVQSETLATTTDYAIIGSGVTACSVVKTLFEQASPRARDFSVTVFEARTLTSGATGRNGGVLTSFVPGDYKLLSETFGHDNAVRIGRFANATLEKMHVLANSTDELREASEVRKLVDVISFLDEESFRDAQESYRLYEEHVPEDRGSAQILTAQETELVSHTCRQ